VLNNNLRLHQIDDTADLSNTVLDDTPANCLQPSKVRTNNQPSTPQLSLKLLGAPEIALDGMRLTALEQSTSAALVLYVLALHRGGLSGERLMAYLVSEWEDMDPLDAGATLSPSAHRTYIWRLRKLAGVRNIVVAHAVEGRHHSRYLLPNNTTCDLWEFEDNLDQAARLVVRASFEPDAADRAAALRQEAILLYGGDFCQGVGAGAIARAADYLRQRYLQAVMSQAAYWKDKAMKLCDARQRTGIMGELPAEEEHAWLEALNNYRLVVHVEPYEESAYAGVELCKARLGQRRISMRRIGTRSRAQDPDRDVSSLLTTTPSA
jgi:hypothetical protein